MWEDKLEEAEFRLFYHPNTSAERRILALLAAGPTVPWSYPPKALCYYLYTHHRAIWDDAYFNSYAAGYTFVKRYRKKFLQLRGEFSTAPPLCTPQS